MSDLTAVELSSAVAGLIIWTLLIGFGLYILGYRAAAKYWQDQIFKYYKPDFAAKNRIGRDGYYDIMMKMRGYK